MNISWTKEQVELLIKLIKEGWSEEMVAHAVDKTTEQVRSKIAELQIKTSLR